MLINALSFHCKLNDYAFSSNVESKQLSIFLILIIKSQPYNFFRLYVKFEVAAHKPLMPNTSDLI